MRAAAGRAAAGLLAVVLASSPVGADTLSRDLGDVTVILEGSGVGRVLFRLDSPVGSGDLAIRQATLRLGTAGPIEARKIRLRVHPVTTAWDAPTATWTIPWSRPGGDFDDELYGRAELDLGQAATELVFDVTAMVKETLEHGMFADGFLLTVDPAEGLGIRTADLPRLQNLANATLDVTYRKVPAAWSGRGERASPRRRAGRRDGE